jgi:hypothetical protein
MVMTSSMLALTWGGEALPSFSQTAAFQLDLGPALQQVYGLGSARTAVPYERSSTLCDRLGDTKGLLHGLRRLARFERRPKTPDDSSLPPSKGQKPDRPMWKKPRARAIRGLGGHCTRTRIACSTRS